MLDILIAIGVIIGIIDLAAILISLVAIIAAAVQQYLIDRKITKIASQRKWWKHEKRTFYRSGHYKQLRP